LVFQLSGGDSTEALHNLIAVATRSLKEAKQWNKDDDAEEEEDEDVIAVDESSVDYDMEYLSVNNNDTNDSSPVNSLFQQFRKSSNGSDNVKSLNGYSTGLNYQQSSPRSALKGTATAASTRRRNEAIMEYIRQAVLIQDNVYLPTDLINKDDYTNKSQNSDIATDCVSTVSWALASELHDHRIQLRKFQSRIRNLEQR
uniref:GIT domain-containing protein n=1 Tax=Schistosoma curassoni TaxID=6186 RepID=A0A183L2T1_9TREM